MMQSRNSPDLPDECEADSQYLSLDLHEFYRKAWHLVEPSVPFSDNFAVGAIAEHLQAVEEGQIKKLIINIPPRTGKSTLVTVLYPCWAWTRDPTLPWMFASYSQSLSYRDSTRRRDLVMLSDWFKARWGDTVNFDESGQRMKHYYVNSATGAMFTTSTGGTVTGHGGERLVLDDPQDPTGAESEVQRESTIEWLNRTWPTRKNSPNAAEILIMQRLNENDATGIFQKQGGWEHLKIPMENAGEKIVTCIGWQDPREEIGQTIDDERFPKHTIDDLKRRLGPYGVAGQLQQEPAPQEGGLIKRSWINLYQWDKEYIHIEPLGKFKPMDNCLRFSTVDMAFTEEHIGGKKKGMKDDPDYTVVSTWAIFRDSRNLPWVVLLDIDRKRVAGPDIIPMLNSAKSKWKPSFMALESIGAQSAISEMAKRQGIPVRVISTSKSEDVIYTIDKDKTARALAATPLMADGRFWVPAQSPFTPTFINELCTFPNAAHDDQVDVAAYAVTIAEKLTGVSIFDTMARRNMAGNSHPKEGMKPKDRDKPRDTLDRFHGTSPF